MDRILNDHAQLLALKIKYLKMLPAKKTDEHVDLKIARIQAQAQQELEQFLTKIAPAEKEEQLQTECVAEIVKTCPPQYL